MSIFTLFIIIYNIVLKNDKTSFIKNNSLTTVDLVENTNYFINNYAENNRNDNIIKDNNINHHNCITLNNIMYNDIITINIDDTNSTDSSNEISINTNLKNIILLIVNDSNQIVNISDATTIFSFDNENSNVNIDSIELPETYKYLYNFSTPEIAVETLNTDSNLHIDNFISIKLSNLINLIDSIEGIEINIDQQDINDINSSINTINTINGTTAPNISKAGSQILDGTQLIAYSKISYKNPTRYEHLTNSLADTFKVLPKASYLKLLNQLVSSINTDISNSEIFKFAICLISKYR